jgi:hypothetical protein
MTFAEYLLDNIFLPRLQKRRVVLCLRFPSPLRSAANHKERWPGFFRARAMLQQGLQRSKMSAGLKASISNVISILQAG